jgi:hypothetical protein
MLKALSADDALAVAEISLQRSRDERAMVDYLGIGQRNAASRRSLPAFPLLRPAAVDLAAFEGVERQALRDALERLTIEARRELIALIWFAKSPSLTFEAAHQRAWRIPAEAQISYLSGQRIERHVAAGLEKLGYRKRM